jgi:hypothetical protein
MNLRRRSFRLVALAVVVALPLLGTSGVASAKVRAKGCHKTHSCKPGAGTGSGTGSATPPPMTVQIDPNPLVETGQSYVLAIVQVETSPSFAGDPVEISSSQLQSACAGGAGFVGFDGGGPTETVTLDDDGNVTVYLYGLNCAPGTSVVEASLVVAPYYTALATLDALPPVVTTLGVTGYPQTSGTVSGGEVETGDTSFTDDGSYVYGVFYVEADPVYAEQTVEISSPELQDRCGTDWGLESFNGAGSGGMGSTIFTPNTTATTTLDDDGNAVFLFEGASCAAGPSTVIADVEAGTHPTYTTTFSVLAPQPTI